VQANLIISSEDQAGKKQTTTISHIRPSQKSHATELATALNALTTNQFVGASVNEINVDITGKTEPTLTISGWSTGQGYAYTQVTYNGDGQLYVSCPTAAAYIDQTNRLTVNGRGVSGEIYATEGTNYSSKTLSFTTD
jgi:hypothetical protein